MVVAADGERETEITDAGWFPPQLQIRNMAGNIKASFLMIRWPSHSLFHPRLRKADEK